MDWRDEARNLLERIDPFFEDVLIGDRRPGVEIINGADDWLGLAGPLMGSQLPEGRPGRAGMLINDAGIRRAFPEADGELLRLKRLGIVLHEAVHCVEFGRAAVDGGHPLDSKIAAILSEAVRNGVVPVPCQSPEANPWHSHGATFHRLVLHVLHRANALGAGVWMVWTRAFGNYDLSSGFDYLDALDGEPARLAHLSLFDVREQPWPAAFRDLWRKDTGEKIE